MVPPSAAARRPGRHTGPLRSAEQISLPVGQSVRAPIRPEGGLDNAIRDVVISGGFNVVQSTIAAPGESTGPPGKPAVGTLVAERKVRRVATSRSMSFSMAVLLAAGVGLGALDVLVGGSWTYAVPWVLVAGIGSLLLWLRYGRSYESEVVAVSLLPLPTGASRPAEAESRPGESLLLWSAGRVRSVAFAGVRLAVDVKDCPVTLMDTLAQMVRQFQAAVR